MNKTKIKPNLMPKSNQISWKLKNIPVRSSAEEKAVSSNVTKLKTWRKSKTKNVIKLKKKKKNGKTKKTNKKTWQN